MTHNQSFHSFVNFGIKPNAFEMKKILSLAWVYQLYQWLVGANKYTRMFANEFIDYKNGERILDLGCGPADIVKYLPKGANYTGIDISPKYINKAKEAFPDKHFICGDIGDPSFPLDNHTFDTVFLIGVQHHLDDDVVDTMFSFAADKLKQGGKMVCLEPVYTGKQGFVEMAFMRNDRGKFIRNAEGYMELMHKKFPDATFEIRPNTMNIPFTIILMRGVKNEIA